MRLWNEYEGTILADSFTLQKLVEPEGRSAFFLTSDDTGKPALIRVIEAHFDQPEILARWELVTSLHQPHLLKILKFGPTELDGTPLLYAVMERSDANLAEVLRGRPLTVEETRQIAVNLLPAIQALHAANLVHEHIQPLNILAIGEEIKLRSDCVREQPEGQQAQEVKTRDVQNFATVLLECLTQRRTLQEIGNTSLPAPFNQIIRNALNGTWGLQQISDSLAISSAPPAPKRSPATPPPVSADPQPARQPDPQPAPQPAQSPAASVPSPPKQAEARPTPSPASPLAPAPSLGRRHIPDDPIRHSHGSFLERLERKPLWLAAAAAVLVLAIVGGWHEFHSSPQPPIATLADTGTSQPAPASAPAREPHTAPAPSAAAPPASGNAHWRVVAFTYNHREQAQAKASALSQKYPDLHPEVFTPSGRAPFLVSLGGVMSREQAEALKRHARGMGLPRDTYTRNYSGAHR